KRATDKIVAGADRVIAPERVESDARVFEPTIRSTTTADRLRAVADTDPNLALVGLRIEIEKKLRQVAEHHGIIAERKPVGVLLRELVRKGVIPDDVRDGLA